MDTGETLDTLESDFAQVTSLAFSPDGMRLAIASERDYVTGTCSVWNICTGMELQAAGISSRITNLSFSSDGRQLIAVSEHRTIRVWNAITGAKMSTEEVNSSKRFAALSMSNGEHIAGLRYDGKFEILNIRTGRRVMEFPSHHDISNQTMSISSDSRFLVSASRHSLLKMWSAATETVVRSLEDSSASIELVAFSPAGDKLVSMSRHDGIIKLCDINRETALHTLPCHGASAVAFLSGGKELAIASLEHNIAIWDTSTGVLVRTIKPDFELRTTAFTSSSTMVASASKHYMIRLWDIETQEVMQTFKGHSGTIRAMAFSPCNRKLASASNDQTIRLWHTDKGVTSQIVGAHLRPSESTLGRMKNATREGEPRSVRSHVSAISKISFSSDGKRLVTSCAGMANIWDVRTGKTLQTMEDGGARRHGSYESAIFSPDGQYLAFSSPTGQIKIHNTNTGEVLKTLEKDKGYTHLIAYSPNGSRLATLGSYPQITVWNTETWTIFRTTYFPTHNIRNMAFSLDSELLVLTRDDEKSQVWDCSADLWSCPVMHTSITTYPGDGKSRKSHWGEIPVTFYPSIHSGKSAVSDEHDNSRIGVEGHWLTLDGRKVLWLPVERRPVVAAVRDNTVALGSASGLVSIMELTF